MDADETSRTPPSTAATKACRSIDEHCCTLRALLRLVDPESPFQPILLSSIDIVAWLALFGRAAQQFGESLTKLPKTKSRSAVLEACEPFLRLAATLSEGAEFHAFPPEGGHVDDIPEMALFDPDSAMQKEDADAIVHAMAAASQTFEASAEHRRLLCRTLSLAAGKLKQKLEGPGGLLRLMKAHCRTSRPFRRQYTTLIDGLKAALAAMPDPEVTPWEKCQIRYTTLRYQLETDLLLQLEAVIKALCSPTAASARKPEALKTTTLRVVTAFLEAHGLARSLDTGLVAVRYHTLFRGLLAPVAAALHRFCNRAGIPSQTPRLIEDLRRLGPQVIKRDILTSWDTSLTETDHYATEVILAALHQLERHPEDSDGSAADARRILGISDTDLARWLRSGTYAGADPRAEISKNRAAETKRAGRTLQYLRCVNGAFHDRRQWTPADSRNSRSTQHRLWTVNPLLAVLPRIATRLEMGSTPDGTGEPPTSSGSRPRPTRRNRGTRPRTNR
jgi:hypothetical protein